MGLCICSPIDAMAPGSLWPEGKAGWHLSVWSEFFFFFTKHYLFPITLLYHLTFQELPTLEFPEVFFFSCTLKDGQNFYKELSGKYSKLYSLCLNCTAKWG